MKKIEDILLIGIFAAVIFFAVASRNQDKTVAEADLPPELSGIYRQLSDKGYKPETSPKEITKPFITFNGFAGERIVINSKGLTTIYRDGKSFKPITYADGLFLQEGRVIHDDPVYVDGLLNIIQNKDYE